MTATITAPIKGSDYVVSNKRVKVRKVVFSGNYATLGENITAAQVGLRAVEQVLPHGGVATSTDILTANPVGITLASNRQSFKVLQYEGSAAGTALSEKTDAEVYATGSNITLTCIGY